MIRNSPNMLWERWDKRRMHSDIVFHGWKLSFHNEKYPCTQSNVKSYKLKNPF